MRIVHWHARDGVAACGRWSTWLTVTASQVTCPACARMLGRQP